MLQALVKVALSTKVHHPNIVPVLGVAECPKTKELLLVRMTNSVSVDCLVRRSHPDMSAYLCQQPYNKRVQYSVIVFSHFATPLLVWIELLKSHSWGDENVEHKVRETPVLIKHGSDSCSDRNNQS